MKSEEIIFSVKQCLNGRTDAFSPIVRHFQERIFFLCLHFLGTRQDAEDAAADIFINAYNALDTFNPQYKFSTWLFKIAVNRSLEILRKQKRERNYLDSLSESPDDSRAAGPHSPADVFFKNSRQKSLENALNTLPEKYRTALMLKYHEGFSYQQISDIMDMPVNTVGSLILRGKKELREKSKEKEGIQ
jgi:RNA polymerase sigma-70 factor (ECF subfamily)